MAGDISADSDMRNLRPKRFPEIPTFQQSAAGSARTLRRNSFCKKISVETKRKSATTDVRVAVATVRTRCSNSDVLAARLTRRFRQPGGIPIRLAARKRHSVAKGTDQHRTSRSIPCQALCSSHARRFGSGMPCRPRIATTSRHLTTSHLDEEVCPCDEAFIL